MNNKITHRIKTITEYHDVMGLAKPEHPSVSVVNYESIKLPCITEMSLVFDFYAITLDRSFKGKMKYGQQQGDFEEGVLFFMAPGQVFEIDLDEAKATNRSGWLLLIHPDFLYHTSLAKTIKQYEFFSYSINEALFLSHREETLILEIMQKMAQEYQSSIDKFSQPVIVAQLELLLTYSDRYYQRQFITRQIVNHTILDRLESLLAKCFTTAALAENGIPTVQQVATALNVSPGYLSGLLKSLTGQSTQQYIHAKIIENAKLRLSTTSLSVSEIAYELGFDHPQSFSRLFKSKTNISPLEFRAGAN
jgi:AraC family transcriptional regulator, transcriptional activator of pobA